MLSSELFRIKMNPHTDIKVSKTWLLGIDLFSSVYNIFQGQSNTKILSVHFEPEDKYLAAGNYWFRCFRSNLKPVKTVTFKSITSVPENCLTLLPLQILPKSNLSVVFVGDLKLLMLWPKTFWWLLMLMVKFNIGIWLLVIMKFELTKLMMN